jgi:lysyl-tRNA synthetase class 2
MTAPHAQRRWAPRTAALLCLAIGVLDVWSALYPADRGRLRALTTVVPGALTRASTALTLVTGVLLVLLARGLRRRKRRAWRLTVALLVSSVVLHVLKGLDVEEAVVAVGLLVTLWLVRDDFYAKGDPRTRWRAVGAFLGLLTTSFLLGLALIGIRSARLADGFELGPASAHVLLGMVGVEGPLSYD